MNALSGIATKNILLLEDDPVSRRLLEYEFRGEQYNLISVCEADPAVERLSQQDAFFDLGIFDMKVPARPGEVVRRDEGIRVLERARARFPAMALIAITSMDTDDIKEKMDRLRVKVFRRPIAVADIYRFANACLGI